MDIIRAVLIIGGVIGLGLQAFGVSFGRFSPGWGGACAIAATLLLSIAVK